jgi:phage terminase large subunit
LFGLDFGYTNDPTAFVASLLDKENRAIYIYDEIYKKALTNKDIYNEISYRGYGKEKITADGAEPKSIEELKRLGLRRIRAARKGPDSISFGIQKLQDYKIYIHPRCENALVEFNNYIWDSKNGQPLNKPIDDFNHLLDALRYATESMEKQGLKTFRS